MESNISMPGVVVFSKTYCSFCAKLKSLLRDLRIPFRTLVRGGGGQGMGSSRGKAARVGGAGRGFPPPPSLADDPGGHAASLLFPQSVVARGVCVCA